MVNQRQKAEMRDYLVDRLRETHTRAEPRSRQIINGAGETDYILLGSELKDGIVLLANRKYGSNRLNRIYQEATRQSPNVGLVFYKDGKSFFRSVAAGEDVNGIKSKASKLANDRSMKNYTVEDFHKMIAPQPEEKFSIRNKNGWIQYFQPDSQRLEQGIVSYRFKPVELDYSHIPSEERYGPITTDSKKTFIWTTKHEHGQDLILDKGMVKTKKE